MKLSRKTKSEINQRAHELSVQAFEVYRRELQKQAEVLLEEGAVEVSVNSLDVPIVRFGFFNQ